MSASYSNLLPNDISPELFAYTEEVARDLRKARRSGTTMLTVSHFETTPELISEYGSEALQTRVRRSNSRQPPSQHVPAWHGGSHRTTGSSEPATSLTLLPVSLYEYRYPALHATGV